MSTKRRPLDFAFLRAHVRPVQVLRILGWREVGLAGGQLRGPCPVHGSRSTASRSFAVSDRVAYCHACKWSGDAVELWARTHSLQLLDAAYELCEVLRIPPPVLF